MRKEDLKILHEHQSRCRRAVRYAKKSYFSRLANNVTDPNLGSKKYWSILNQFLHKWKSPRSHPVRYSRNNLIADVTTKENIFNIFFANQCSLTDTDSVLPQQTFATNLRINNIPLDEAKILALIRALTINKAHGWDNISIQMIKICDESLVKPLMKVYQNSLDSCIFPSKWKKANVVPVYKNKGDKCVKNYRPMSLLPIFGKIFEKCIFDSVYTYFENNNLFINSQSGFRKGDSCV